MQKVNNHWTGLATGLIPFYTNKKQSLDFSDNCSFVLQDAAQGFHWNNSQATIHPFVAYYMKSGELHHLSYVIISDCLNHGTVAVHLFQKHFIQYLKKQFSSLPRKTSDGAASQESEKLDQLAPP